MEICLKTLYELHYISAVQFLITWYTISLIYELIHACEY